MGSYVTLAEFRARSLMPGTDVDALELEASGWILTQLELVSRRLDARLAKRYAVPFAVPYPLVVVDWVVRIVTLRAFLRRGVDPTDAQFVEVKADHDRALAEVLEAADAAGGLFELPLRADTDSNGVTRGAPLAYSEAGPYVGFSIQGNRGRLEDSAGTGSSGE